MNGVGGLGEASESSFDEIEDTLVLVSNEINRRLQSGRVRDIADGTLFRYHQDLTKWAERNKKEEIQASAAFDILDQIELLPEERVKELLTEEINVTKSRLAKLKKALAKTMSKEINASK
jgi:hypothetical protein